jgi:hypothetical protein
LNFLIVHRGRGNSATAFINRLFDECSLGVCKELVISHRKDVTFRNLHAGIPTHNGVRSKQEIELLLE